jgi:hypothetical protein
MSFLDRIKYGTFGENGLTDGRGLVARNADGSVDLHHGFVVDKVERFGAALAFGYAKGYYHPGNKFTYRGLGKDLWVGAGLHVAAVGLTMFSEGRGPMSDAAAHLERIGDAGISSYLNSLGAAMGYKKATASAAPAALPAASSPPLLGAIPAAMGGAYLTADEIAHFSAPR